MTGCVSVMSDRRPFRNARRVRAEGVLLLLSPVVLALGWLLLEALGQLGTGWVTVVILVATIPAATALWRMIVRWRRGDFPDVPW